MELTKINFDMLKKEMPGYNDCVYFSLYSAIKNIANAVMAIDISDDKKKLMKNLPKLIVGIIKAVKAYSDNPDILGDENEN